MFFSVFANKEQPSRSALPFWLLLTGFKIVRVLGVNIIVLEDCVHVFLFVCLIDVNVEKPDEKSILTYLATLCDTLESVKTKSLKRPASPTKTSPRKPASASSLSKESGVRTLSPEPEKPEKHSSKTNVAANGREDRQVSPSPTPLRKQTKRSTSPLMGKDERSSSPTPPSGNGKIKAAQSKLNTSSPQGGRTGTPSPKSSTSEEPMEISSPETNLSPPKRRDARSTSPSRKSTATKKPRMSQGKLSVSPDHTERLKTKRLSLADSKRLSVSSDIGRKKRASVAGTLSTSRRLSSTGPIPMDVESSSSELEESEVRVYSL